MIAATVVIASVSTCTAEFSGAEVRFDLRDDRGSFRWYFPDGSPTNLFRGSVPEARRAMMFNASSLVREYLKAKPGPLITV
jgi:hypothetical protein